MKDATYKGVMYIVPSWTKWLAEDSGGGLYAYSAKPYRENGSWITMDGRWEHITEIDTDDSYDPAHEEDMRQLMRQQLRDNITAEEAEEEMEEREAIEFWDDSYDDWAD